MSNTLVLFVLLPDKANRCIPDLFFINLAVADLLFLMTLPFFAYVYATGSWLFGDVLCRLIVGFDGMNQFTGILTLLAMSFDRYFAITYPVRSKTYRTIRKARLINVLVWIVSFLCSLPLWVYADLHTEPDGAIVCQIMWPNPHKNAYTFLVFAFIVGFVAPVSAMMSHLFTGVFHHHFSDDSHRTNGEITTVASIGHRSRRIAILLIAFIEILEPTLMPIMSRKKRSDLVTSRKMYKRRSDMVFMQDGTLAHTTHVSQEWCSRKLPGFPEILEPTLMPIMSRKKRSDLVTGRKMVYAGWYTCSYHPCEPGVVFQETS
uniref:Somatostatin receptor type 2-like n=1 Tax=Saccoglossus kowalevskii TaxID=10224 RepID=A0ABM0MBE7_SACKO|nr:PREDICTED: somatostatin receptor type 2-like [Saccoglossus kowalevskii]